MVQYTCDKCGKSFNKMSSYKFHINRKTPCVKEDVEYEYEDVYEDNDNDVESEQNPMTDTFEDLSYDSFTNLEAQEKINEELKKIKPEKVKPIKAIKPIIDFSDYINKTNKTKQQIKNEVKDDPEITQILGREKLVLLTKIESYKTLFPDKLKTFKYKKNCSVEEMHAILEEFEYILSISTVDEFLTDSIIQSIKMIEPLSSISKFDITGLAESLKANDKFYSLIKQLSLKYSSFLQLPPEYQLLIVVSSSALFCVNTNKIKKNILKQELHNKLFEPIVPEFHHHVNKTEPVIILPDSIKEETIQEIKDEENILLTNEDLISNDIVL